MKLLSAISLSAGRSAERPRTASGFGFGKDARGCAGCGSLGPIEPHSVAFNPTVEHAVSGCTEFSVCVAVIGY